jgi:ABC-type transport system involved in Fe-S cluster assembly fused permease/ATPase subunit
VLQILEVPLSALHGGAGIDTIAAIRLRFDQVNEGVVIVDDIGVRRSRPPGPEE